MIERRIIHELMAVNRPDFREYRERRKNLKEQFSTAGKHLFGFGLVFISLWLMSLHSYILAHSFAELAAIVVAFSIFVIVWNSREFLENDYIQFLGVAFLFLALLDLVHTLAYKGMGVFHGYEAQLSVQIWIATRSLQSLAFLIAPLTLVFRPAKSNKRRLYFIAACFAVPSILLLASIFYWGIFPTCYIDGIGLTPFKRYCEYLISLILLISLALLLYNRDRFDDKVLRWLTWSIIFSIGTELVFSFHVNVYDLVTLIAHCFKIMATYFLYRAVIETGITRPYALIFRELKQSEGRLREREELYRGIFETNQAVKLLIDPETGDVVDANQAACRFYGYSHEELRSKKIFDINTLSPEELQVEMTAALSQKRLYFNFSHRLASGEVRDVEVFSSPVNVKGKSLLFSIINDITEKRRFERELTDAHSQLEATLNALPDLLFEVDRFGRIYDCRSPQPDLLFSSSQELIGRNVRHTSSVEANRVISAALAEAVEGGKHFGGVYSLQLPKGLAWFELSIACKGDPEASDAHYVILVRDITKRKKAEHALRESEAIAGALLNAPTDSVLLLDQEGTILDINEMGARRLGREPADVIGKCGYDLVPPDVAEARKARIETVLSSGKLVRFEDEQDGLWLDQVIYPVVGIQGAPNRVVIVARDVTERINLQNAQGFLAQCGCAPEDDFFKSLAKYLAEVLRMDYVCIDRLEGNELYAQTEAVYFNEKFEDNVRYALTDTPCGDVVGKSICCFPEGVRHLFPKDEVLQDMMAESYVGATLWSSRGKPIGLIAVIGRRPLEDTNLPESLLQMVSVRAASELERRRDEEALRDSEERLNLVLLGSELGFWDWNIETGEVQRNERWARCLATPSRRLSSTSSSGRA